MVSFYKYQSLIRFEMFELRCVEKRPYAPLRVSYIGRYHTQIFASFLRSLSFDILKTFSLSIGSSFVQLMISERVRPQEAHSSRSFIVTSLHWNVHGDNWLSSGLPGELDISFLYI